MKELFKLGIVVFVLITAILGYALGYPVEKSFSFIEVFLFLLGLTFLSAGSFALNEVQEWQVDKKMPRTQKRPIASGQLSVKQGFLISVVLIVLGSTLLFFVKPLTCLLGLITILLYNGFYTIHWKYATPFGAVPGAIPGAMPALIGFSVVDSQIFSAPAIYVFLIMFLWQMPHFWALTLKYKDDYEKGGVPVLPLFVGKEGTLYHSGLYTLAYLGLALASPLFVEAGWFYLFIVLPVSLIMGIEFWRFFKSNGEKRWLPFFLWTNFSMLLFLAACVLDRWSEFIFGNV